MKTLSLLVALIAALGCGASAHAQSFPSRPVTIVVPYGPGGPADILARIMAERMRGAARPAGGRGECRGRGRHHGRQPRRPRRARRLHAELRQLGHACAQRRDPEGRLRRAHRSRADRAAARQSVHRRHQRRGAGQQLPGAAGLAQSQSEHRIAGHRRLRHAARTSSASISRVSPARNTSSCLTGRAPRGRRRICSPVRSR